MTLSSTKHTDPPPPAVNDVGHVPVKRWCFSVNAREVNQPRPAIENLRHTRDVAHPGRCHPPIIRFSSRDLVD
eukprot:678882-Prorocentrum_minimum.AAC.2